MSFKIIARLWIFAIAIVFLGCSHDSNKIDLSYKLQKGETNRVYAAVVTTGEMKTQNITEMKFTVEAVEANKNLIDVNVVRISSHSSMFGETESYDSKKDVAKMSASEKEIHEDMKAFLHQSFLISIDNKGRVLESFKNKETSEPTDDIVDMTSIYIPLPTEPVKIKSEWTSEKVNSLTKTKTISTYTLENINESSIFISVKSEIEGVPGILSPTKAKGNYVLDRTTCKMKSGEYQMKMQDGKGTIGLKFSMID